MYERLLMLPSEIRRNLARLFRKQTHERPMKDTNRRVFMMQVAASSAVLTAGAVHAQAAPALVNEKDPQAVGLGYVADTTKVDAKRFPKHAATQKCSNCTLYTGKAGSEAGPCGIFPGKAVAANGWCSAYVKKA